MDIMDIMDTTDIMDTMGNLDITAWMAMAGAVLALVVGFQAVTRSKNNLPHG